MYVQIGVRNTRMWGIVLLASVLFLLLRHYQKTRKQEERRVQRLTEEVKLLQQVVSALQLQTKMQVAPHTVQLPLSPIEENVSKRRRGKKK